MKTTRIGLFALPAILLLNGGAAPAPPAHGVKVAVTITDLRNADGRVLACMTSREDRFPRCRGVQTAYTTSVPAHRGALVVNFADVKPGRYAIALLHDENGNGKADRALGMMPKEGFGFSNDAPVKMGPPKFDAAAFHLGEANKSVKIRMRYVL